MPRVHASSLHSFTKPEQQMLQVTAEMLHTSVDVLIAAANVSASPSSNGPNEADSHFGSEPTSTDPTTEDTTPVLLQPTSGTMEAPEFPVTDQWVSSQAMSSSMAEQWDSTDSFPSFPADSGLNTSQTFHENERIQPPVYSSFGYQLTFPNEANFPSEPMGAYCNPIWPALDPGLPEEPSAVLDGYGDINHQTRPNFTHHDDMLRREIPLQAHEAPVPMPAFAQFYSAFGTQASETEESYINVEGTSIFFAKQSPAKKQRRGPYQDPAKRKETEITRKLGACIPCSLQRIRVRG